MGYYFSPSTRGFYHDDLHDSMPADVVAITAAEHDVMIHGQSDQREIVPLPDGKPTLAKKPPHHHPDLFIWDGVAFALKDLEIAKAYTRDRLRVARAPLLAALDLQVLRAWEQGKTPYDIVDVLAKKQQLRDITKLVDQAASWEELAAITVE